MDENPDRWRLPLAALLGSSGVLHLVRPEPFCRIVPPVLGPAGPWVSSSGVAELACAVGLVCRGRVRRGAGLSTAVLLVAVFPANVYMAWSAWRTPRSWAYRAATLVRLPLQLPLVVAALSVGRLFGRSGRASAR